jgi:hypothetical protein
MTVRKDPLPEIVIEENIPMPEILHGNRDEEARNLFKNMKRGDSFFIVTKEFKYIKALANRLRVKISYREEEKDDTLGYRIWYVEVRPPKEKRVSLISKSVGGITK